MPKYQHPDLSSKAIDNAEHIDPGTTGDNVAARKVGMYAFGTDSNWLRAPLPLIDAPWDYIGLTNPDVNGNYQTLTFKNGGSGGATVRTLTLAFDGSSNITTLSRA